MTEDRTIDDDKAVLAAEFGYMTTVSRRRWIASAAPRRASSASSEC